MSGDTTAVFWFMSRRFFFRKKKLFVDYKRNTALRFSHDTKPKRGGGRGGGRGEGGGVICAAAPMRVAFNITGHKSHNDIRIGLLGGPLRSRNINFDWYLA